MKNKDVHINVPHVIGFYGYHGVFSAERYLLPLSVEKLGVLGNQFIRHSRPPEFAESVTFHRGYAVPLDKKNYYTRTDYFARCQWLNPDLTPIPGKTVLIPCRRIDMTHAAFAEMDARQKAAEAHRGEVIAQRDEKANKLIEQIKSIFVSEDAIEYSSAHGIITIKVK